jgi:deoxycytidylate deaminase
MPVASTTKANPQRPELVIALIGPTGCDLPTVIELVQDELQRFGYTGHHIKVSAGFRQLGLITATDPPGGGPRDIRYKQLQDAGDRLRAMTHRSDAAMLPALRRVSEERKSLTDDLSRPAYDHAFIIDSLKTPAELRLLQSVYGSRLLAISTYVPRPVRKHNVAQAIAESRYENKAQTYYDTAEGILWRDERGVEEDPFGQDVANVFPLADLFISSASRDAASGDLHRFFNIIFSDPFKTPSVDEYGMALAHGSALRSSALGRQVGAAILTERGQVVAAGTNEVPRAFGGQYWPGDDPDGRDFTDGHDSSYARQRNILGNTLKLLLSAGWRPRSVQEPGALTDARRQAIVDRELRRILDGQLQPKLRQLRRGLLVEDIVEYYKETHAEMAALLDAAMRGTSVLGCTLYVTTFPCHECARHVVWSGIKRVVFIEPYPKSLVDELYRDSIDIDGTGGMTRVPFETFVGLAPQRYVQLFEMPDRRSSAGKAFSWHENTAELRPEIMGVSNQLGDVSPAMSRALRDAAVSTSLERERLTLAELRRAFRAATPPTRTAKSASRQRRKSVAQEKTSTPKRRAPVG